MKKQKVPARDKKTNVKLERFWLDYGDQIKDVVGFFIITIAAFGYCFMLLMLISFITLSYIQFTIQGILIASILGTIAADVFYIVKKVKKYRKADLY